MDFYREAVAQMAAVSEALDKPELRFDNNGFCAADIEGIPFFFLHQAEPPSLLVQARLGAVDDETLEELLRRNHLWGGTGGGVFGLTPDGNEAYLSYRLEFPLPEGAWDGLLLDLLPQLVGAVEAALDNAGNDGDGGDPGVLQAMRA